MLKFSFLLTLLIFSGCALFDLPKYAVSYDSNGATGGVVPATQIKNSTADLVISRNTGLLVRIGYEFVGWNTSYNGSGTDYPEGSLYSGNSDLFLIAKWIVAPDRRITIGFDPNHATSGAVPPSLVGLPGGEMVLPGNEGNLERVGWRFVGWEYRVPYDPPEPNPNFEQSHRVNYDVGSIFTVKGGGSFFARWESLTPTYTSPNIGLLRGYQGATFQFRKYPYSNDLASATVGEFKMSSLITGKMFDSVLGIDHDNRSSKEGMVQYVNYLDAILFCNKLSQLENLTPVYTIPGVDLSLPYSTYPSDFFVTFSQWNSLTDDKSANGYRLPRENEHFWFQMESTENYLRDHKEWLFLGVILHLERSSSIPETMGPAGGWGGSYTRAEAFGFRVLRY